MLFLLPDVCIDCLPRSNIATGLFQAAGVQSREIIRLITVNHSAFMIACEV